MDITDYEFTAERDVHEAVGKCISSYFQIELALAGILQSVLKLNFETSNILFRALNRMALYNLISVLLKKKFGPKIVDHWDSCVSSLQKMADFRNALAHWHVNGGTSHVVPDGAKPIPVTFQLTPPPGQDGRISKKEMRFFITDCRAMVRLLNDLSRHTRGRPSSLPKRFLRPITYQPQASHLPFQTSKKPKRQRPPSVPKLSRAQRRDKALKDAKASSLKPKS